MEPFLTVEGIIFTICLFDWGQFKLLNRPMRGKYCKYYVNFMNTLESLHVNCV